MIWQKKIVVIPGDGIGEEITSSAVQVLKKIDEKFALGLEFTKYDAGGTAYDKFGTPLPQETIDACKAADGVLFGAMASRCGFRPHLSSEASPWRPGARIPPCLPAQTTGP